MRYSPSKSSGKEGVVRVDEVGEETVEGSLEDERSWGTELKSKWSDEEWSPSASRHASLQ